MLMQFSHYTDDELLRFIRSQPNHLMAEGELVRRVTADEWGMGAQDEELRIAEEERDEANAKVEDRNEEINELKQMVAQVREAVAE